MNVEHTNEATEMMDWFGRAFDDSPVWEVRKRVAFQRAFSAGQSIFAYVPELDMCDSYTTIASELDQQFDGGETPAVATAPREDDQ